MVIAMNSDSALRELVDKMRLDLAGGANGSYTAYEKGRIAEKHKCIHELESILAAPQDQPIDADDNAGYIEHCANLLDKHGYRITGTTLRAIASVHRDLTTKAPQAAPAGMVLVPVEPTAAMVMAGWDTGHLLGDTRISHKPSEVYAAMIAAAPAAQVAVSGEDPHEFGAGIKPNPEARYWQNRASFWRNHAVALGYGPDGQPADEGAYECWDMALSDAQEIAKNSRVKMITDRAENVVSYLKNHKPSAAAPAVVVDEAPLRTRVDALLDKAWSVETDDGGTAWAVWASDVRDALGQGKANG